MPHTRTPDPGPRTPDPGPRTPDPGPRTPGTLGAERVVILASRTLQALVRLHHDLAPLLAVDHRIRLRYTLNDGSDRRDLAERRAAWLGIPLVPWKQAIADHPDLVVSASAGTELHEARAALALLPHGATYNRVAEGVSGAAGTAPEHLVGPDGELPAFMAMPGRAAMDQLAKDCPEALGAAVLTGDLCMERLRASVALRRSFRRALGVRPGQFLVVVSSTWGSNSVTGQDRDLPRRLMSMLPADEFRVAYVPHPNIDADHGGSLAGWLRPLTRNGLIVVPPEEGWRALLVAADCVIGDAGSVTLYAANLGVPVLLRAFGFEETASGTPQEAFGREAEWLRPDGDVAAQIRAARPFDPDAAFLAAAWDESRSAAEAVVAELYRLLGLAPVRGPGVELLPEPETVPEYAAMSAWACWVTSGEGALRIERFAAFDAPVEAGHLVVRESCRFERLLREARVVLVHDVDHDAGEVETVATETTRLYKGALVSVRVGPGRAVVFGGDRGRFAVSCDPDVLDLAPSVVYERAGTGAIAVSVSGAVRSVLVERLA